MQKQSIATRIVASLMLLACVLCLSTQPAAAEEGSYVGGNTGSLVVNPGGQGGGIGSRLGQFTRFTLVRIGFGHDNAAITSASSLKASSLDGKTTVLGSIDVSDPSRRESNGLGGISTGDATQVTAWYKTNALDYVFNSGNVDAVTTYFNNSIQIDSWAAKQYIPYDELLVEGDITQAGDGIPAQFPIFGKDSLPANYLVSMMTSSDSDLGNTDIKKSNALLDAILRLTSQRTVGHEEFASIDHDYTYRLLVEPGWVLTHRDKDTGATVTSAMTLRDIAAYAMQETNGSRKWGSLQSGDLNREGSFTNTILYTWYYGTQNLSHGLYLGSNELCAYNWNAESSAPELINPTGTPVFLAPPASATTMSGGSLPNSEGLSNFCGALFGICNNGFGGSTRYNAGECVGYGLGVISPYNFPGDVQTALTVTKVVTGEGATDADKNKEWEFKLETHKGDYSPMVTEVTSENVTISTTDHVNYTFKLKGGQSANITVKADGGETVYYTVRENLDSIEAKNFATKVTAGSNVAVDETNVAYCSSDNGGVNITFNNDFAKAPTAHLLVDVNMLGQHALVNNGSGSIVTVENAANGDTNIIDCGTWPINTPLTVSTGLSDMVLKNIQSSTGQNLGQVKAVFKGIYTKPTGGTRVDTATPGQFTTTLTEAETLTVYYAQWELQVPTITIPTTPTGPDYSGAPANDNLYTVFWDQNYIGGGVASSWYGVFHDVRQRSQHTIYVGEDAPDDYWTPGGDHQEWSTEFTWAVKVLFETPHDPIRTGWDFKGWSENPRFHDGELSKNVAPWQITPPTGRGTTFYAIWGAKDVDWHANGGKFADGSTVKHWDGWINANESVTVPIIGGDSDKDKPERTGYTFDTWYFDPMCSMPATKGEEGVFPGLDYYAGWTAENVKVNYYDTRQGETLITTQEYDYDDVFSLLADIQSTDGWTFNYWRVKGTTQQAPGTGTILNENFANQKLIRRSSGKNDHQVTSDTAYWEIDLEAVWTEEHVGYQTTIVWNDYQNNDGVRPKSVEVGLISSVTRVEVMSVNYTGDPTDNTWTIPFEGLSITDDNSTTQKTTYTPYLKSVTDTKNNKYVIQDTSATTGELHIGANSLADTTATAQYDYAINNINGGSWLSNYSGTIYFNHDLIGTGDDVEFTVSWRDESDNDGMRPESITVQLYANGVPVQSYSGNHKTHNSQTGIVSINKDNCVVDPASNTWKCIFEDYQKYDNGEAITYSAKVLSFSNGKEAEYQSWEYIAPVTNAGGKVGVILTHNIILRDVEAVFNWYDNSNFDGRRPDSINVELTANEWNRADNRWQNSKIMGKYATLKTSDFADGSTCDQWTYTFKDVPVYCGGQRRDFQAIITSNLNMGASEGDTPYTWDEGIHGNPLDNITPVTSVNIEHGRDLRDVEAVVEWSDYNNNDGIRPKNIIVKLYGDQQDGNGPQPIEWQEATIGGDMTGGTWRHTFKNVNRYADHGEGIPVIYSIRVEETTKNNLYGVYVSYATGEITEVVRYTPTYRTADLNESSNADDSVYPFARLSHEKDQGVMNIYVSWNDTSNRDGKRPGVVLVDFYKRVNGQSELFHTYQLYGSTTAGAWHQKVTDLPLYENGSAITYYIDVSDDFRRELAKSDYTAAKQENIINLYYTPIRGPITAQVRWDDNNDNDGIRPSAVLAELYYNGQPTGRTVELNDNNNWTTTWEDLATYYIDQYGNVANLVSYGVRVTGDGIEEEGGYTATYTPDSVAVTQQTIIYVGLKHESNTAAVPVRVLWNDGNNSDGVRPNTIELQLYANGKPVVNGTLTVESNGTNEWTGEFIAQPTHEGGKAIVYSVAPSDAVTKLGYTGLTAGTDLYLSRDADKGDLYVSFRFADANNADGYRPQGGYLQLYVAETPNGNKRRVTDANGLHTIYFEADGSVNDYFYSLPIYSAPGKLLYYTVEVEFDNDQFGGDFTKYEPPKVSKPISLSKVSANQLVITMQRDADLGTETGNIYWFDCGNKRGNRPQRLSINVRNDSTSNTAKYNLIVSGNSGVVTDDRGAEVGTVKVYDWGQDNNAERWEYTISGLRQRNVYEDGAAYDIHYFAKALAVGYQPYYTATDDDSMDVLLTHVNYLEDVGSSTMDYTITINWMDNNNAWAYRPDTLGLDVKMVYGNAEYASAHLTKSNIVKGNDNAWTYTFRALPTFIGGQRVDWDTVVIDTPWYAQKSTKGTDHADYTLFQSIGFNFTANWVDSSNDDGIRPAAVRVNVYGDGKQVGSVTLNGTGNTWKNFISGLPVWREVGTDVPVVYTFDWSDGTKSSLEGNYEARPTNGGAMSGADTFYYLSAVEFGSKSDTGLNEMTGQYEWETTIVHGREREDVYGTVIWDDDNDRDGKRPESGVFLQLYADGNALEDPVEIAAEGNWTYTWQDEFVNETGGNITYSVKVVDVPKGYTVSQISNTEVSLKHIPERVIVTGTIFWDDETELRPLYNINGEQYGSYPLIDRAKLTAQLVKNGKVVADADIHEIPKDAYGADDQRSKLRSKEVYWTDLYKYENHGEEIVYTFEVGSKELDALIADGYKLRYDNSVANKPKATISRDYFDVRGSVYYLYKDSGDDFLLPDVPVTAYVLQEDGTYMAVGSTTTDANGRFEMLNIGMEHLDSLRSGQLIIRATYQRGKYAYAGSVPAVLDRCDVETTVVVDRDANTDSDLYRYTATGKASYQTDIMDPKTKKPVPAGSIVLLYEVVNISDSANYVGMTTTDKDGQYRFSNLKAGKYLVNVVFNYAGGTYTYDNADAIQAGLSFNVLGADMTWPEAVKQVNAVVTPDPVPAPEEPDKPGPVIPDEPQPCIVSGKVLYSENGAHTEDPVANVDIYIYSADNNVELAHVITDSEGRWTADGLAAQDYIAVFSYQGAASRVLLFTVSDADYEAGTYEITPQYFDCAVKEPVGTIRGVVLSEDGQQVSALIQILDMDGNVVDTAYTNADAMYSFTVPAGENRTYRVKIMEILKETRSYTAGNPEDGRSRIDYYTVSGNFSIDGEPQKNCVVAIMEEKGDNIDDFTLLKATMTNSRGDYSLRVDKAGNYKIVCYINDTVFSKYNVTVGYENWKPVVTANRNGTYTISGRESYESITLYDVSGSLIRTLDTLNTGNSYSFTVPEGVYVIQLTKDGQSVRYYATCPDSQISRTYYMTISGNVVNEDGSPSLGAIVGLYDSNGNQVGSNILIRNGKFAYSGVREGNYEIRINFPTDGRVLVDRTTAETDTYGRKYATGMTEGGVWEWNLNAVTVGGMVTDQDGEPFAGATVVLRHKVDLDKAYGTTTDENGVWTVGVTPGEYNVEAIYQIDNDHRYQATEKKSIVVGKANVQGVDFIITRYNVTAKAVRQGDFSPLANADVEIRCNEDGILVWSGETDTNGQIDAVLMPGNFRITVNYEGSIGYMDVLVNKDVTSRVVVGTPIYLSGKVYNPDGTLANDAIVYYSGPTSGRAYTVKDGEYRIPLADDQTGTYTVYAEAQGNQSPTSSVDVFTDTTLDLHLVKTDMGEETYKLTGVVTDNEGKRLSNAIVIVTFGDDKEKAFRTSTDMIGEYSFELPNGTYYLQALYEADNGYMYATNGYTSIAINRADAEDINLGITVAYAVNITVKEKSGTAVSGATIAYTGALDGESITEADGTVTVMLRGGSYELQASYGNRKSSVTKLTVGHATNVTLYIDDDGLQSKPPEGVPTDITISGRVIDYQGNVVQSAYVVLMEYDLESGTWVEREVTFSDETGFYEFTGIIEERMPSPSPAARKTRARTAATSGVIANKYRVDVVYTLTSTVDTNVTRYAIRDYALDAGGNPYSGARVNRLNPDTGAIIETVIAAEDGYYEFLNLEDGVDYCLEIIPAGMVTSDNLLWDVAEPDDQIISGTVIDITSSPVNDASVVLKDETGTVVAKMITEEDGKYQFDIPGGGTYTVEISYPSSTEIELDNYVPNSRDPNAPKLQSDNYAVAGIVLDTDGTPVANADVTLEDESGDLVGLKQTGEDGSYLFAGLRSGTYHVKVRWNGLTRNYVVDATGEGREEGNGESELPENQSIQISGVVTSGQNRPLTGAQVSVTNVETGAAFMVYSGRDGRWQTGSLATGRYEIYAIYAHEKGSSVSDKVSISQAQEGVGLVVILSYSDDINGDGEHNHIHAGADDRFDTPDDFYLAYNVPGQERTTVYIGADRKPGTADDWYEKDMNGDGKPEKVFVGVDKVAGTKDDWYEDDGKRPVVEVTIRFDANGGTVDGKSSTAIKLEEFKQLPQANRTDYTFNGWFTQPNGGRQITANDVKAQSSNVVFYAQWTKRQPQQQGGNQGGGSAGSGGGGGGGGGGIAPAPAPIKTFEVAFDTDGGSKVSTQTVKSGEKTTKPTNPTKTGFEFVEWMLDGQTYDFQTTVAKDLTLKAVWREVKPESPVTGPAKLLTTDHVAYVWGRDDGLIHPHEELTRAEITMIFYRLLREDVRSLYKTSAHQFSDVSNDDWFQTAVATMAKLGIMKGRGDGIFDPNAHITRAELAVVCARFDELASSAVSFADVSPDHWAYKEIMSVTAKGWAKGIGNGKFAPDRTITRAEAIAIINRMLGRDSLTPESVNGQKGMTTWADNADTSTWFYLAIQEAGNGHTPDLAGEFEVWKDIVPTQLFNE